MTPFLVVARRLSGATQGSAILLVLLIAFTTGFVEFTASGARRTETSFSRFTEWSDPPTAYLGGLPYDLGPLTDWLPQIESLHSVEDWEEMAALDVQQVEFEDGRVSAAPRLNVGAVGDSSTGGRRDRALLLGGRFPAPDEAHAFITDFLTAEAFGLRVGDELTVVMGDGTRWPAQLAGVVSVVQSFPTIAGFTFSTLLFPKGIGTQHPEWVDPYGAGAGVWVRGGTAGIDQLSSELDAIGLADLDLQAGAVAEQAAKKVVHLQAIGLWLAAGVALATGVVVIIQVLARQRNRAARDIAIGRAVGLSNRQVLAGAVLCDAALAIAGALLGTVVAIALSPLTPFGLARNVEADPGMEIDTAVITVGIVAASVVVVVIGGLSTLALLRRGDKHGDTAASPASRVGGLLAEPLGTGWRIAFGHRRGIVMALMPATMTVIAFVVVATSVHDVSRLPQRPELTGGTWDAALFLDDPAPAGTVDRALHDQNAIASVARGGWTGVRIGDTDVYTQILEPGTGIEPAIARGRAPTGENEIALGRALLDDVGADIGDDVTVTFDDESGGGTATWNVVGEVVVASPLFFALNPDDGGLISDAAFAKWFPGQSPGFLVKFQRGVSPQAGLDATLADMPPVDGLFAFARSTRGDVVALDSMLALPWMLVGFLALLTIASLAQWSILSSRRERHRAAVLRALGLTGSQVSAAFVAAAVLVAGTAGVLGVAIGATLATKVWNSFARWLTVVPTAEIPWALCSTLVVLITLAAMALAGLTSRRHAGSTAAQLRVE